MSHLLQISPINQDGFFYDEMMAHPVLFTHPIPKKVALLGENSAGILAEILKHPKISEVDCVTSFLPKIEDKRVQHLPLTFESWLKQSLPSTYNVVIHATPHHNDCAAKIYQILEAEGILVIPSSGSLLDPEKTITLHQELKSAGFRSFQVLNFVQPSHQQSWRLILMAGKQLTLRSVKEKEIFNRSFPTRYYNFDTHKAALALPEFAMPLFK